MCRSGCLLSPLIASATASQSTNCCRSRSTNIGSSIPSAMIFRLAREMPVAVCSGAGSRLVKLAHTLERDPWAEGLPRPALEKIRQPVLPHREAIAGAKLVPEHQHDQRGRESFFASQGDLYLLVFALAGERDQQASTGHQHVGPYRGATPASASARRNAISASQIRSASDLPSQTTVTAARRTTLSHSTRLPTPPTTTI